jgi:hypothetical protein
MSTTPSALGETPLRPAIAVPKKKRQAAPKSPRRANRITTAEASPPDAPSTQQPVLDLASNRTAAAEPSTQQSQDRMATMPPSTAGPSTRRPKAASTTARTVPAVGASTQQSKDRSETESNATAGVTLPGPSANEGLTNQPLTLADPVLSINADIVDDLERTRMANVNRIGVMTRVGPDEDGQQRGWGLSLDHPQVKPIQEIVVNLAALEKDAVLQLQRAVRKHPLWTSWGKDAKGVGEKQFGRLIASIGDPYINTKTGLPRTVGALRAYCGLHVVPAVRTGVTDHVDSDSGELTPSVGQHEHDIRRDRVDGGASSAASQARLVDPSTVAGGSQAPATDTSLPVAGTPEEGGGIDQTRPDDHQSFVGVAPRRRRGERANWSTRAKTKAYLISESCMKQIGKGCKGEEGGLRAEGHLENCDCSVYRIAYDKRRAHTAVTHGPESERPWTKQHLMNDALRYTSKAILRDLWRAARQWHLEQGHLVDDGLGNLSWVLPPMVEPDSE